MGKLIIIGMVIGITVNWFHSHICGLSLISWMNMMMAKGLRSTAQSAVAWSFTMCELSFSLYRVSHLNCICSSVRGLPLCGMFVVFYHGNWDESISNLC